MPEIKLTLKHGLKIGNETLFKVVIKDHLTAGEIREASQAAEKIVMVENEPALVISPTAMSNESLRRQIKSIGDISGPISQAEIDMLHEDDLFLLNKAADNLEKIKTSNEVAHRGRTNTAD